MISPDIRSLFPIFKHRPDLVYLDSAATTLKPESVIDAERRYYEEYSANVERGLYPLSERATTEYEAARGKVAKFVGADTDEIVFTRGTTESVNLLGYALEPMLQPGDEILVTAIEHHSNFLPWQALAQRTGATLKILPLDQVLHEVPAEKNFLRRPDEARVPKRRMEGEQKITSPSEPTLDIMPRTKIFAFPSVSNVLGTILPVAELVAEARRANPDIITVVDAAQSVAHLGTDVRALDCDFLAFSGHKMFGPTGIGVLYGKRARLAALPPFHYGGEMVARASAEASEWKEAPHKFEAGTPPIAQAIALGAAVDFIGHVGIEAIREHERDVLAYALDKLRTTFGDTIRVLGPEDVAARSGVIAFTIDGVHPHDLAHVLGESDICIRAGRHCAEPLHDALGVPATARLSVSVYTSQEDIDTFVEALEKTIRIFE